MDAEGAREWMQENGIKRGGESLACLVHLDQAVEQRGDKLGEQWPAAWYALVQDTRRLADVYEAALIRKLRAGEGPSGETTWASVAAAVDSHLGSRQAAQQKWKRLLDGNRREYGGPGRGGRQKTSSESVADPETERS
ncbi:hypothetical protein [Actinomycetospora soli]|uniref:hypothetical protein n=1 Tax=Actinomycetospora soli TaxID=2893887 RepID=UPI001E2EBAFA|nr:hypothetical protein [Actinomycetospora soli]MCD2191729.1 hypothetical protein [Actinomycetospora soli]